MNGGFTTPLKDDMNLMSLKKACFSCPMFEICNGCSKTIKDLKEYNMVEDHCQHMKSMASDIIALNRLDVEVSPYEREYYD
jgi:sulfatase maturation enzyme AslB (radical SAM superfamily)